MFRGFFAVCLGVRVSCGCVGFRVRVQSGFALWVV